MGMMGSTHQNLLHPGEWNFKCENQDDSSREGDGQAPDEVHHNIEKADLWANSCDEKIYTIPLTSLGYVRTERANMGRTSIWTR